MSILVPSSLLVAAGDNAGAQRLVLASSEWLELQTRVQSVLALPSDMGEYEARYGDASAGGQMKECFDAMHKLQETCSRYGNPARLRASIVSNPNLLTSAVRPRNDAYSATVWTLQQAHRDAFTLSQTFAGLPELAKSETAANTTAGIKSLFLDQDQIIDRMSRTVLALDQLINEFTSIESALDTAQNEMKTFTERSSKTRVNLDEEIGALRTTIAQLEKDRDAAWSNWVGLTVAACAIPAFIAIAGIVAMVVLAVPTGGASFAIGSAVTGAATALAAAGLATAAGLARSSYDALCADVANKTAYMGKRVCYRSDLGALDQVMKFSLPASNGVIAQLTSIRDAWHGAIREVSGRVAELNVSNLSDGPWLKPEPMRATAKGWADLDSGLTGFLNSSLIDANLFDFGAQLPTDDPNWQNNFVLRKAA